MIDRTVRHRVLRGILETVSKETLIDYLVHVTGPIEQEKLIAMYNKGLVDGVIEESKPNE